MGQENNSRFSHISVGQTKVDDTLRAAEDEETITIGAVEAGQEPRHPQEQPASPDAQDAVSAPSPDSQPQRDEASSQASGDLDFGPPMPLAQRLVIAVCGIALVVTLVFLVRFWVFA
jgi:uncharacterized membrane protein